MFGSTILEVAIGMIFVYLLLSLICSATNEIIESALKNRATDLERGIRELFNQKGGGQMVKNLYQHPLIHSLFDGEYARKAGAQLGRLDYLKPTNLPTYIPAGNFAAALIDLVLNPPPEDKGFVRDDSPAAIAAKPAADEQLQRGMRGTAHARNAVPVTPVTMTEIVNSIERNVGDNELGRALRTLAEQAGDDVNKMRENIEGWFNSSMDRVSGWYKRRTKWIILCIGFALTVFLNVNTITIINYLSTNPTARSMIVAQAEAFANNPDAQREEGFDANRKSLESLGLPLGWPSGITFFFQPAFPKPFDWWKYFLSPLIGWLITAAALSLGAPFWFDLLNKFMVIRSTVKPHEKSPEESSEDRQDKKT